MEKLQICQREKVICQREMNSINKKRKLHTTTKKWPLIVRISLRKKLSYRNFIRLKKGTFFKIYVHRSRKSSSNFSGKGSKNPSELSQRKLTFWWHFQTSSAKKVFRARYFWKISSLMFLPEKARPRWEIFNKIWWSFTV